MSFIRRELREDYDYVLICMAEIACSQLFVYWDTMNSGNQIMLVKAWLEGQKTGSSTNGRGK